MQPSYRRLGRDKFKALIVMERRPPLLPYQQIFTTRGEALKAAREYIGKKEKVRDRQRKVHAGDVRRGAEKKDQPEDKR